MLTSTNSRLVISRHVMAVEMVNFWTLKILQFLPIFCRFRMKVELSAAAPLMYPLTFVRSGAVDDRSERFSSERQQTEKTNQCLQIFFKWAYPSLFMFIFVFSTLYNSINWWKHRWVLGTQTRGGRMEGAEEFTELWRHPSLQNFSGTTLWQRKIKVALDITF